MLQSHHIRGIGEGIEVHLNAHFTEHLCDGVCGGNLDSAFAANHKFKAYAFATAVKAKAVAVLFGKAKPIQQQIRRHKVNAFARNILHLVKIRVEKIPRRGGEVLINFIDYFGIIYCGGNGLAEIRIVCVCGAAKAD